MDLPLGDHEQIGGSIVVGATAILTIAATAMALYFRFRRQKIKTDAYGDKTKREAEKEEAENEARLKFLEDLRKDNNELRKNLTTLQNATLERIIIAHEQHAECEQRFAALEERHRISEQRVHEAEAHARELEARISTLEEGKT